MRHPINTPKSPTARGPTAKADESILVVPIHLDIEFAFIWTRTSISQLFSKLMCTIVYMICSHTRTLLHKNNSYVFILSLCRHRLRHTS